MNKDKIKIKEKEGNDKQYEIEIINLNSVQELIGIEQFWLIILKINDDVLLSTVTSILFPLYKNKELDKLLDKCISYINDEKSTTEMINKSITLLRQIIIESEKYSYFNIKSHLSLLKNYIVNLPIKLKNTAENVSNIKKHLLTGNTTIVDLKQIISSLYQIHPNWVKCSLPKEYINKVKELKNFKNQNLFKETSISEDKNNISLNELLLLDEKLISGIELKERLTFIRTEKRYEEFIIDGKINPKFKKVLQDLFQIFTKGTGKMDTEGAIKFIKGVTGSCDEDRAKEFILSHDKEDRGYVNEDEFIGFYYDAAEKKNSAIWSNLAKMNIRRDFKKEGEPFDIDFTDKNNLPRYKLGNNINLIKALFEKYQKKPNEYQFISDFLLFISTNESLYNQVLDMFEEKNNNSYVYTVLNDENKYIEQYYIFIIIESIFQDLQMNLYKKNSTDKDFIKIGDDDYKLLSIKYEPFDSDEYDEKKLKFVKNFIKTENIKKIFAIVDNLLSKLKEEKIQNDSNSTLFKCCIKGFSIINMINCFRYGKKNEDEKNLTEFKINKSYQLGDCNLSSLFPDVDFEKEFNNISYENSIKNYIDFLNISKSDSILYKHCLSRLIEILSLKEELYTKYTSEGDNKKILEKLFMNNFSETFFIETLMKSVNRVISNNKNNKEYIYFLNNIINSKINELLNLNSETEKNEQNKSNFTLNNLFFDFYNQINEIISNLNSNNPENKIIENNSYNEKIYDLIKKELPKNNNDKTLLNIFRLFIMSIKKKDTLDYDVLLKTHGNDNESLFDLIFSKYVERQTGKKYEEENNTNNNKVDDSSQVNTIKKDDKDEKFICIEEQKNEEKEDNIDDSSSEEFNNLLNELITNCLIESNNSTIIDKLLKIIHIYKINKSNDENKNKSEDTSDDDTNWNQVSSHHTTLKKQCGHVGLKNLGCICYMNSIMQQIYMVPTFRYAIMQSDDGEKPKPSSNYRYSVNDDNLLHQLQEMYTYLTFSNKMDYNPKGFCYSYKDFDGNPVNIAAQQDSQEFCNNFCDKIENGLRKTKFKYIVNDVFTGRTCSSVICEECKHISNRFEDFYNLTLEVKNINNLNDSLQKLIVPEVIDDFKCSNCNKNVRISKITSLYKLPNVLIVHLKRFYMDYETCNTTKINSKFEFPKKIDLKPFCVEETTKNFSSEKNSNIDIYIREDEYYKYELKGINVHIGSADGGHYFSFINVNREGKDNIMLDGKEEWLTFNDSSVSEFDTKKIPSECYGGSTIGHSSYENCQNAYLLIYERKKKNPIRVILDDKEKNNIDKDKIVLIDNDNKIQINKDYDLNRVDCKLKEEELYQKIFYEKEKDEYYKYIPYYNIPKYAPKKAYLKCIKENKSIASNTSEKKESKNSDKKYRKILYEKITDEKIKFDISQYNNKTKELILKIVLNYYIKKIEPFQSFDAAEKADLNKEFNCIIKKLIKPLVHKNTKFSILKIINELLCQPSMLNKLYSSGEYIFSNESKSSHILNKENAKIFSDILYDLVEIFLLYGENSNYQEELQSIVKSLISVLGDANSMSSKEDPDLNIYTMGYIFQITSKLIVNHYCICKYILEHNLLYYLMQHFKSFPKEHREDIYELMKNLLKGVQGYTKNIFEFKKGENEGQTKISYITTLIGELDDKTIEILFEEKIELLNMFIVILSYEEGYIKCYDVILELIQKYCGKNKDEQIINIIFNWLKIKDCYCYERYYRLIGYPTYIIKDIPINDELRKNLSLQINANFDSEDEEEEEEVKDEKVAKVDEKRQNWPIFGEKLINGDINQELYKYRNPRFSQRISLLEILFPDKSAIEQDKKEEEEKKKSDPLTQIKTSTNKLKLNLSEESKKKLLLKIYNEFFGPFPNFYLFKYIYLMPSRTLAYENLYEEIKALIKNDIDTQANKDKEEEYIKKIKEEIKNSVRCQKSSKYNLDDDSDEEITVYTQGQTQKKKKKNRHIKFIGFNSDIIPGDIVKEHIELYSDPKNKRIIYRIEYFTKYHKVDEFRKKLLEKQQNEEKKDDEKDKDNVDDKSTNKDTTSHSSKHSNNWEYYDVSNKNEIEFLFNNIKTRKAVIEDKNIKDKNDIKSTLIRYIILNRHTKFNFRVRLSEQKDVNPVVYLNFFFPDTLFDSCEDKNIVDFIQFYRTKGDLHFEKEEYTHMDISIL